MPHNRGTRRKPRYVGLVSYKGHTRWAGTHPSVAAYKQAEHERLIELREEVDRPDFEVISDEQYEQLCRCARASRADNYGLVLEGVILAISEAAMRPARSSPSTTGTSTTQPTSSTCAANWTWQAASPAGPRTTSREPSR